MFVISAPSKMKKYSFWSCEEELEAMKHMATAVSIYRIHEVVTFENGAQQIPNQHHLCVSKDMRNTSNHEETGLPATSTRLELNQSFKLL